MALDGWKDCGEPRQGEGLVKPPGADGVRGGRGAESCSGELESVDFGVIT